MAQGSADAQALASLSSALRSLSSMPVALMAATEWWCLGGRGMYGVHRHSLRSQARDDCVGEIGVSTSQVPHVASVLVLWCIKVVSSRSSVGVSLAVILYHEAEDNFCSGSHFYHPSYARRYPARYGHLLYSAAAWWGISTTWFVWACTSWIEALPFVAADFIIPRRYWAVDE